VVILIIEEFYVLLDEPKGHSPVTVHPDRPVSSELALERMGSERRDGQILRRQGNVERGKDALQLVDMLSLDSLLRSTSIERFQPFVPEASDHLPSVSRNDTRYIRIVSR